MTIRHHVGALLIAALALVLAWPAAATSEIEADPQNVRVIDGDTIQIGDTVIQLYGIDAPELGQQCLHGEKLIACGWNAAFALRKLILVANQPITCTRWGRRKGRYYAVCKGGKRDLANALLVDGTVVAAPNAFPDYVQAQNGAKSTGLGMWRGKFIEPEQWRKGVRLAEERATPPSKCPVMGLIGDDKAKRYVVPTDSDYEKAKVDKARGERCFDSDDDARAAGWS